MVWAKMMRLEKDIEDLNLDFSDRCIDKPKALQNLVYEFQLNGDSSGASSLESLDFGYDDGFFFDHQLDFPAINIPKTELEIKTETEKLQCDVTNNVKEVKADNEVAETTNMDKKLIEVSKQLYIHIHQQILFKIYSPL